MINKNRKLKVYRRGNGTIGIRNYLLVIPSVFCANHVAQEIAAQITGAFACTHPHGCGQLGADAEQTLRMLVNMGSHPNVGAVLVVGLGCEQNSAHDIAEAIRLTKKPVESLVIQEEGGTTKTIEKGIEVCNQLKSQMSTDEERVLASPRELVIGLECGGSDFTSGMASNPSVGVAADMLVDLGAIVMLGETAEALGAEHILASRAVNNEIKNFIINKVAKAEKAAELMGVDMRGSQPSPGNIAGGLSTIAEKSLGAICKSGSTPIVGGLEYACIPDNPGVYFMDTPGQDLSCTCGLVAGGAHIVLFTTGRGSALGNIIAPVIKITANSETAKNMEVDMDVDLSGVIDGTLSLVNAGEILLNEIFDVADGKKVKAEIHGHREFGFHSIGPTL